MIGLFLFLKALKQNGEGLPPEERMQRGADKTKIE